VPGPGLFLFDGKGERGEDIIEPRINERIRVQEVRLVGPEGEQVGIVRIEDALRLAQEADLDLVEVAPESRPPVAKLMDYGKFKYEAAVKAREARRNQANTVIKEIRFRLKIDDHDYATKRGHIERFLKAGDKVKVTIMFRGREQSRPDAGRRLLQRLADDVGDLGVIEHSPVIEGRNMSLTLGPTRKKAEAREEARREREVKLALEEAERAKRKPAKVAPVKVNAATKVATKAAPKAAKAAPKTDTEAASERKDGE
jgi:translation initiation factor IF-3